VARRAFLVGVVAILSGLAAAGVAVARQNAQPTQPASVAAQPPVAPAAKPAPAPALRPSANPTAPPDLRAAQPAQPPASQANPTPTPAPKPAATDAAPGGAPPVKPTTAKAPDVPAKRGRYAIAIMQALDKVTTETMRFEVPVGQPIRYKTLIFTVRACETAAADEVAPETAAYVVIDTQPKAQAGRAAPAGRQIYKGWMYASSPGLHPLEHPVYDAWLIACKQSIPDAPPAKP
jgi:hypothetical protein